MIPRQADIRFSVVIFVLAVLALIFSGQFIAAPLIPLSGDLLAMNPRVFPALILMCTAVVTLIFLVNQVREGAFNATGPSERASGTATAPWRQIAFLVITVTFALLLTTLGFVITMFLLMVSTSVLVGNRNPVQILSISIVIPISFFIIVTHVLRTALPEIDIVQQLLAPLIRLIPAF